MNCPKCGLPTLQDQRFCRSCGDKLQITTQPLEGSATVSHRNSSPANTFKNETRRASTMPFWGFVIMFIGLAIGIIGKKLMHDEVVTVVGTLVSLLGMFLSAYRYLLPAPRQRYDSIAPSQTEALPQSKPTKYLPPESNTEYVPSITERTTNLLQNSAAPGPEKEEDKESQPNKAFNPTP